MSIQSSIDKVVNTALQAKIAKTATNYVDLETERIKKENIHEAKAQHAYKQYREAEEGRALEGGVDINNPRFQRMMDKFSEESERERVATNANIKANPEKKDELEAAGQKRKAMKRAELSKNIDTWIERAKQRMQRMDKNTEIMNETNKRTSKRNDALKKQMEAVGTRLKDLMGGNDGNK